MQFITNLIDHYGYIVLFVALMLELIALPTPGEALMTYCGFLAFQGKMNLFLSIIIASSGVALGITISYIIGYTLGFSFFEKHGHLVHLGPDKLDKISKWFERYGNKLLTIAYFIPGVRHITGYFSGITKVPFKRFALYAYTGSFIWTGTFIFLGKVLGPNWEKFHTSIKRYLIIGGLIIASAIILVYLYSNHKTKITKFVIRKLSNAMKIFHSFGRLKIAMAGMMIVFLALFSLVIGLIQDYLSNELNQFDTIISYLVELIFTERWTYSMELFGYLSSGKLLIPIIIFTIIWILLRGVDKFLEIRFLFITILGGELLEESLRFVFHRLGPLGTSYFQKINYTFPSEQSLMMIVIYGFTAFILIRHLKKAWGRISVFFLALIICILSGLSHIFFHFQYPSDIVAGYVFGGVWLSLNIILLEVYRILPRV